MVGHFPRGHAVGPGQIAPPGGVPDMLFLIGLARGGYGGSLPRAKTVVTNGITTRRGGGQRRADTDTVGLPGSGFHVRLMLR